MEENKKLAGKMPPHNIEAEQSFLGSLLLDTNAIVKVADIVEPPDFYQEKHAIIYQAMIDLFKNREPIDILTLSNKLEEQNNLDKVGGRSYLASLSNMVGSASHVNHYADIIQKKGTLRRLIHAGSDIVELGFSEEQEVSVILDKSEQKIFGVSQTNRKQSFIAMSNILDETFERIDKIHKEKGKLRGVPTGFKDLDSKLAGLQNSDLIILAARPSVGKTSLALDLARHVGTKEKIPVGIFSLEMSKEQLVDRMLCAEAGIDMWKMRTGNLNTDEEFQKIGHGLGILSEAPIFIDDFANANIMEIRAKARRLQMEHGLGLIIVDYLQLMEGHTRSSDSRVQEISEISRGLKQIAKELNIPVLALSQLSRAVEQRPDKRPILSDLRESGSIEQDADIVMFIYRESVYKKDLEFDKKNLAELIIAKHRNGPTGVVKLFFDGEKVSFRNLDKKFEGAEIPPVMKSDNAMPPDAESHTPKSSDLPFSF